MERRILKDFQIGFVENLKEEMGGAEQGQDIFSSLAKVIGKRKSQKGGEVDWNAIARKNTMSSDPIGSKRSSMQRHSQRSLRRKIIEDANEGLKMNQNQLIEYNPNLGDVTRATRVAYVKFMKKKMTIAEEEDKAAPATPSTTASIKNERKSTLKTTEESKKENGKGSTAVSTSVDAKGTDTQPPQSAVGASKPTTDKSGEPTSNRAAAPAPPVKPGENAVKPAISKPDDTVKPAAAIKKQETAKTDASKPNTASASTVASKGAAPPAPAGAGTAKAPEGATTPEKSITKAADGAKESEKKSEMAKTPGDKPSDNNATDKKSESRKSEQKKSADTKTDEKKTDGQKDDKKPTPASAKPAIKVGQSSAAAGGDRGKSVVTGRMISGWL